MNKGAPLNDFATRCFRDTADLDYIAARMAYRAQLVPQFHWQALQAIEKYLKAILLYNRVKARTIQHDLEDAFRHAEQLPFALKLSKQTKLLIKHLNRFGRFRYLEVSYFAIGPKLLELDKAVWEIRRYCRVLDYELDLGDGKAKNMLPLEIAAIERSDNEPPHKFRLIGGELETILRRSDHPARAPLVWQNAFFGGRSRRSVRMNSMFHATNAPLTLRPEMLDEVLKYVYLPKDVIRAFRQELLDRQRS